MAKRQKADKSRFEDLTKLEEDISQATGQGKSKTFSVEDTKPPRRKHKPGLTQKNRAKFTTMLRPDLKQKLDHVAKRNTMSIADVLEVVIEEYFELKD